MDDAGRRRPRPAEPAPAALARAGARRPRQTCSTSRPSTRSAPRPTRAAGAAPGHAAGRCSTGSCRASPGDQHPRDLSEGQRLALALAIVLTARPRRRAPRRADARARLPRQGPPRRAPARPRHRGARGRRRDPRRRVRGPGRRRRGGPGRGRGRVVGTRTPGGRRVARLRARRSPRSSVRRGCASTRSCGRWASERRERAAPRVPLRPRSLAVLGVASRRRADDAHLAAAGAGARRAAGWTRRSSSCAAAAGGRRRARRGERGRHGRPRAGDPRRPERHQRGAPRAERRRGRRRAGLLPAHPRRAGLRARLRVRARLHVAVRLGADDRRRRTVAAVPDAGVGVGRDGRRVCCRDG